MGKKLLRCLCAVLAVVLTVSMALPAAVGAVGASAMEIEQQIIRTYKQARSYYGKTSFDGYCAALVGAQLYLLGITTAVNGGNGNDKFDIYDAQTVTSGGYHVRSYPAASYTLAQALDAITDGGTRDVYNLLVGFQETRSSLGRRYGHALVVHAILDGTAYFVESYAVTLGGRYYPEGTPISCSIEEFVRYYDATTVRFDGVIHFSQQRYSDLCRSYPAHAVVTATGGVLRSEPCEAAVDSSSEQVRSLISGEELTVTGLYQNTQGEFWYQVGDAGYVRATATRLAEQLFGDITVADADVPAVLRQGRGAQIKGTVKARYNVISTLRAQVYRLEQEEKQVINATETVEGRQAQLAGSTLSGDLTFRKLPLGDYRFDLSAVVGSYYIQGGQLQVAWQTVSLLSAGFRVVAEDAQHLIVSFDANGGAASMDQSAVDIGAPLGQLPAAKREGHVFLGWYTAQGQRVDAQLVPQQDLRLHARWVSEQRLSQCLQEQTGCYLYSDGVTSVGTVELDGDRFYFSYIDAPDRVHVMWTVAEP